MHHCKCLTMDIPKSYNNSILISDTINNHLSTVTSKVLSFSKNLAAIPSQAIHHNSSISSNINNRYQKLSIKSKDKEIPHSRNIAKPSNFQYKTPLKQSRLRTEHNTSKLTQSPIDNETQRFKIRLNKNHCIKQLDEIDQATLDSLKSFKIQSELINNKQIYLKKKIKNVIKDENEKYLITTDDYLHLSKENFENKRSGIYRNLDYVFSNLGQVDFYNLYKRIKAENNFKEKNKRKELSRLQQERHRRFQKLIEKHIN